MIGEEWEWMLEAVDDKREKMIPRGEGGGDDPKREYFQSRTPCRWETVAATSLCAGAFALCWQGPVLGSSQSQVGGTRHLRAGTFRTSTHCTGMRFDMHWQSVEDSDPARTGNHLLKEFCPARSGIHWACRGAIFLSWPV